MFPKVFTNKRDLFENYKSNQISHVKLNRFKGILNFGLTYDSEVVEIEQISNAAQQMQLKKVTVDQFISIRNMQVVNQCRSCRRDINPPTNETMEEDETMEKKKKNLEMVQCSKTKEHKRFFLAVNDSK